MIELHYIDLIIFSIYIMCAGAYLDGLRNGHRNWLRSHQAGWALRDWLILPIFIITFPKMLHDFDSFLTIYIYATLILVHFLAFRAFIALGESHARKLPAASQPPLWQWRAWEIIPGAIFGFILLWLNS